ncbi:MAG: ribonuclease P protein component [Phycisphaerae bacterium]|nr:ribonuclease P protein component [Phycisphaerae bacterium]
MAKYKYPKSARIGAKADFRAILDYKVFARNRLMTLYISPGKRETARFAVSVSSKIASAAGRNRLKRLAKEAFRLSKDSIEQGFDYLIIFSPMLSKNGSYDISKLGLKQIQDSFLELLKEGQRRFENKQAQN